jgi:hypothetical protein
VSPLALLIALAAGPSAHAEDPLESEDRATRFAVVPLVNFTTDRGVGLGAYAAAFYLGPDGPGEDPYRAQLGTQLYKTTGGYQDHKLVLDLPGLAQGRLRADLQLGLEAWDGAFYFGQGNALPRLRPEDTPENFYAFGLQSLRVVSNLRTPLWGDLDLFIGQLARSGQITVYPESRLDIDQPIGIEGGWLSQAYIGALYDSRDHEFSPTEGAFSELSVRGAHPWLGSTWTMWGANLTDRRYLALGESSAVLATRAAVDVQRGESPFFHQVVMGGSQWVDIGGRAAMRGLPIGRIRGDVTLYGDAELRWEAHQFALRGGGLRVFAVGFVGGARVIQPGEVDPGLHLHGGGGGGLRLLYSDVFLARIDVAGGLEEYTAPSDPMGTDVSDRAWIPGVYVAFSAPY